jgi:hypothetical protein
MYPRDLFNEKCSFGPDQIRMRISDHGYAFRRFTAYFSACPSEQIRWKRQPLQLFIKIHRPDQRIRYHVKTCRLAGHAIKSLDTCGHPRSQVSKLTPGRIAVSRLYADVQEGQTRRSSALLSIEPMRSVCGSTFGC